MDCGWAEQETGDWDASVAYYETAYNKSHESATAEISKPSLT